MDAPTFQLEFWIPKGRKGGSWVPMQALPVGNYRTWRKVKLGHEHPDVMRHSILPRRSYRSQSGGRECTPSMKCDDYCQWARLKGLTTVTTYANDYLSNTSARRFGFARREVPVSDILGPAPVAEIEL